MKTKLPNDINSVEEAKAFLRELVWNDEAYHPDDDAHEIGLYQKSPTPNAEGKYVVTKVIDRLFTYEEAEKLNYLSGRLNEFEGFDQYEFIMDEELRFTIHKEAENGLHTAFGMLLQGYGYRKGVEAFDNDPEIIEARKVIEKRMFEIFRQIQYGNE